MSDAALILVIGAMVILFIGEPDLHDALIAYLYSGVKDV